MESRRKAAFHCARHYVSPNLGTKDVLDDFRRRATSIGMIVGEDHFVFPDRTVILARGRIEHLAASLEIPESVTALQAEVEAMRAYLLSLCPGDDPAEFPDEVPRVAAAA